MRSGLGLSPVQQVPEGQVGVAEGHSRPGVAHHGAYLLSHLGPKAVHGATGAGRLILCEPARLHSAAGVGGELRAGRADLACSRAWAGGIPVVGRTVHPDHDLDGALLAA
jgi:hypothetical protein